MQDTLKSKVELKQYLDLIQEKYVNEMGMKLPVFFGLDVNRLPVVKDITQTGNIILAGATCSGKSTFMHTVLNTFMYLYSPETIKFVLVDPKLVELQQYETSPYLFSKFPTTSMDWKFDVQEYFKQLENLYSNNQLGKKHILVCIDTFSDLIYFDTKRFETIISKLSTMENIYLIMSDSRPEPKVYTPGILNLFPTKLLLKTASVTDSIVFSGSNVGPSLKGQGDAIIYFAHEQTPVSVQCPYIDDDDIGKLSDII